MGRSSVGAPGSAISQGTFISRMLANGEPDPTFGVGGRSALDDIDQLAEAVVLNNGSIVAVGSIKNANNDLAIIKLTNSGKLDLNFGANGVSLIDFGDEEFGTSITLDASGNVYAIGVAFNAGVNADIGIAKLDRTGNLDTTFGAGGRLKVDIAGVADFAAESAMDSRGRLVVAGLTGSALNEAFVIRLVAAGNGQLDVNFSGDGKTVVSGTWVTSSLSLGIAGNDQIFVGGTTFDAASSQSSGTVIKLASNGTLLAGFGNAGRFNFNAEVDSQDGIGSLLIDDRGRLLVLANSTSATDRRQSLTLAAFDASSGNLIRSFGPGNEGLNSIRYYGYRSYRPLSLLQRGGQLIAQGTSDNNLSLTQFSLGDGIVDTGFGNAGHRLIDFSSLFGSDDQFVNMVVQPDGKIITLANIDAGGNRYAALTRTNSDGSLDSTFAFDGRLVLSRLEDADDIELIGERIYVLADDKLLAKPTVVRLFGDGDVDRNYGISGYADVSTVGRGKSLAVANGKVFVGGTSFNGANDDFAVVKLDSFGNVDSSFSGDGVQTVNFANQPDSLSDLKIDQVGRLLLVGSTISTTNSDIAIARLLPNGTLDNNFSSGRVVRDISGTSANDEAVELEVQPTGSYIVAGKTSVAGLEESFLLRLSENGQPLTEFDSDGKVIIDLSGSGEDDELTGIELAPNGQIYVTGKAEIDSGVRLLTRTSFAAFNATTGAIIRNLNPSTGGRVLLTASNYSTSRGAAIKVLSDRVVIGSSVSLNSNLSNLTLHALQIGSALPVANFGSAGVAMVDFVNVGENTTGTSERLTSLDVNRAGESILAGVAANASTMFGTLAKLNDAGKLDNRFRSQWTIH